MDCGQISLSSMTVSPLVVVPDPSRSLNTNQQMNEIGIGSSHFIPLTNIAKSTTTHRNGGLLRTTIAGNDFLDGVGSDMVDLTNGILEIDYRHYGFSLRTILE
jgi:hypothetical protein